MPPSPSWIDPELFQELAPRPEDERSEDPEAFEETDPSVPPHSPQAPESTIEPEPIEPGPGTLVHRVQVLGRWLRLVLEDHAHYVQDEDGLTLLQHDLPQRSTMAAHAERAALSFQRLLGEGPVRVLRVEAESGASMNVAWFGTRHGRMALGVLGHELDDQLLREVGIAFQEVFDPT